MVIVKKLGSYQRRQTMHCFTIIISVVICFCDLSVCYGSGFHQLLTPSQPTRSQFTLNDVKLTHPDSVQQQRVEQPSTPSGGGFLPGIGTYFQPYTINTPRNVRSPAIQEQMQKQQTSGTPLIDPSFPVNTNTIPVNLDNINGAEQRSSN